MPPRRAGNPVQQLLAIKAAQDESKINRHANACTGGGGFAMINPATAIAARERRQS
jgi:hypothetical protein